MRTQTNARILIVEDEAKIAALIMRALSSDGYAVKWARDSQPALELVQGSRFDLILLDLLLPSMDGFMMLQELNDRHIEVDVLVLSALSDVESKVRCFELGVSDYVTKPFSIAELVVRVRTRLRDLQQLASSRFVDGGALRLDVQRRDVIGSGKRVALSTKEYLLLEYLMRREGEICSRQELLSCVWGYPFDPGTNVVDVYVSRLRHKLGKNVIETVRNVGYSYALVA